MFASMESRSALILGRLGSKTRSPRQIKGKTCLHTRGHVFEAIIMDRGHIFEAIIMDPAQNVCLDDF